MSQDQQHGLYTREPIAADSEIANAKIIFHLLQGGPGFLAPHIDNTIPNGSHLNWSAFAPASVIAQQIIQAYSNDPNNSDYFNDIYFQQALLNSHRNSTIDMALFSKWHEWSFINVDLIKKRLKEMSFIDLPEKTLLYDKLQMSLNKPIDGERSSFEVFDIVFSIEDNPKLKRAALKKLLRTMEKDAMEKFGGWNDRAFEENKAYLDLIKQHFLVWN